MRNHTIHFALVGLVAVLCAGCGGQKLPSDLPKLYPTVITVMQDGKPLAAAMITLTNVEEGVKWGGAARTNAEGKATMMTNGMYEGTPEGTYKATVVKQEQVKGADPYADAPDPKVDQDAYQRWYMQNERRLSAMGRQTPVVFDLVDPQFRDMNTTTLEVKVSADTSEHTLDVGAATRVLNRERPK